MSTRDGEERASAGQTGWMLPLAVLTVLLAALFPVAEVIQSGAWVPGAAILAAIVLTVGRFGRWRGLPAVAVTLLEIAAWAIFLTAVFLSRYALLWIIPTPDAVSAAVPMLEDAFAQIRVGVAPLEDTSAISFLIVGAMGLLAVIIDHVAITARMPLLAIVGVTAVTLIPVFVVPHGIDLLAFVVLAASALFLLRADTRSRQKRPERRSELVAGVPATAIGIGAIAVVVAVAAAPALTVPAEGPVVGSGAAIDATLRLGDDLRRPAVVEVLQVTVDKGAPPYLRVTTLSDFEGGVWHPDRPETAPLEEGFGDVPVEADISVVSQSTHVRVTNLASSWLPVAYPAVSVTGAQGNWRAVPYSRTVVTASADASGQQYDVITNAPQPSLERIRDIDAVAPQALAETMALPEDLNPEISRIAHDITAGTTNDYDSLISLQRWFRGGTFQYSLDAPVENDFDGSGATAVAKFLEVRRGYCVHFASAFALMARTLGMPSRIVVGYLPGTATGDANSTNPVYSVTSDTLHAWPEVYFPGVGWVSFEPTTGLGTPTAFASAVGPGSNAPSNLSPDDDSGATPTTTPTTSTGAPDRADQGGTAVSATSANPLPVALSLLGILLALSIPALVREVRHRSLASAAGRGDAIAAWKMLQDAAIDVGVAVPTSETPRAFGARLVALHGAPPDDVMAVVGAVERASYARAGTPGVPVADAAHRVRGQLLASVSRRRRLRAIVAPRSLVVRPGSGYAASREQ